MKRNKNDNDEKQIFSQEKVNKFIFECIMNKYKPTSQEEAEYIIEKKRIYSRILEHNGEQYITIQAGHNIIGQRNAVQFLKMDTEEEGLQTLSTLKEYFTNLTQQGESESSDLSQVSAIQGTNKSSTQTEGVKKKSGTTSTKPKKSQTKSKELIDKQAA